MDNPNRTDKSNFLEHYLNLLLRDEDLPIKQIWCSMCDPDLPKGSQFLGAVVVEAQSPVWATYELNAKGLNLGGEILFVEIPEGKRIPNEWMYRVMNREEAENCPLESAFFVDPNPNLS